MADLFQGQTMTEMYRCISAGTAETFTFNFEPDMVRVVNLTQWVATAGKYPISVWYKDVTTTAHAYQHVVIDSAAGASFNFREAAADGFTVANTSGGSTDYATLIAGVTAANPCVVTTTASHGYVTGDIVRITDLGNDMPVARGMEQLNNNRYSIVVTAVNAFSLRDPETLLPIDSTSYTAWVAGGRVQLETRVLANSDAFAYDPVSYRLTVGTAVMGANSDVIVLEVYKFGQYIDLGDMA